GAVTFKTSPNFENPTDNGANNVYDINVIASDGFLTDTKAVAITVNDINEVPTDLALSANTITENTVIGSGFKIGDITITDPDVTGNNNVLSLTGTDAVSFELRNNTELYFIGTSPDFETKPSYSINLKSTDGALTYSKAFTINVNDVNEVPTITSGISANFAENGTGTAYTVTATDPDAGTTFTYSISGTDASLFNINSTTGAVTFKTSPNFENPTDNGANNVYDINVIASDGFLTDTKAITITVNDINEVPTDLTLSANTITENTVIGLGFKIGDITITDPDVTGNNNVLSLTGTDAASFELRNNTELYFIGASPDFETKSGYSINLKSTDGALTYSKAFTVNVNDVNEVPTDFSFAPRNINEHTLPTQIAGLFSGRDPDIGDVLSYSFVAGTGDTDNGLFLITSNPNGNINPPPIAWYSFEGNTSDTNGTKNSTAANGVTYTGGRFGNKAAVLDGNSSYIDIPQSVLDNFSISAWIKTTDTSNNGNFWWEGKGIVDGDVNGISNDFGLALLGNKAAFGMGDPNNNTDITIRSQTTINDGNWHHLAVTRNRTSGAISLYVDGIQEATIVGPTGDITAPPRLRIGGLQNGSNFLAATIDEVQIYDRALSAQEVIALNRANTINTNNNVLILNTASPSIDKKPVYNVRVKISDQNGLGFEKPFSILVNDLPPTVQSPKNNDVLEFRGNHDKSQIRITIDQNNSTSHLLNEVCAYKVDDADGKINGLGKNDNGYVEAALGRSIVVFSTLANLPGGFKNEDVVRSLEMKYGDQVRFYLVKGNTTQDVLRMKNYTTVVMEPLQVSSVNSSTFLVKFSDLSIKVESSTELPPSGTSNSLGQQGAKEGELLYVGTETKATFTINREAAYNNFVGFYKVVDQQGGIDINNDNVADFKPGDAGYAKAAIDNRVVDLTGQNQVTVTGTGNFTANSIFAPFIIVDGNAADFAKGTKQAYFTYLGANSDGVDHIRLLGNNIFGFEDLPSGGDRDFNDIIVKVTLKA
ncbi:MAG: LamG-like jellyroll fold domain-containing protein, partial [Pseudanabaenaceae cyanobacterium]